MDWNPLHWEGIWELVWLFKPIVLFVWPYVKWNLVLIMLFMVLAPAPRHRRR